MLRHRSPSPSPARHRSRRNASRSPMSNRWEARGVRNEKCEIFVVPLSELTYILDSYCTDAECWWLVDWKAVFRIHDILVWIWIRGSIPLTNGSGFGFGSCYFRHWPSRRQQNTSFKKVFLLFTSFFKDKKSKRSHKTVGSKVFLTIFAWW